MSDQHEALNEDWQANLRKEKINDVIDDIYGLAALDQLIDSAQAELKKCFYMGCGSSLWDVDTPAGHWFTATMAKSNKMRQIIEERVMQLIKQAEALVGAPAEDEEE